MTQAAGLIGSPAKRPDSAQQAYEKRLQTDPEWAISESAKYFDGSSQLHQTLQELRRRLDELSISYVVVDGMALTVHGCARMTDDIDVLITRPELKRLHAQLVGRGYKREFAGGKNIRDTTTGVKIEFVLTGDYPGSGAAQPVSFPDPSETDPLEHGGVRFIGLVRLVELKLASGMTSGADRAKDLVDVQQLVTTLHLPRAFEEKLHEYVRPQYVASAAAPRGSAELPRAAAKRSVVAIIPQFGDVGCEVLHGVAVFNRADERLGAFAVASAPRSSPLTNHKHRLIHLPCTARARPRTRSSRCWRTPAGGRSSSR